MRRLVIVAVIVSVAGCSPAQERLWLRWFHREPRAAVAWVVNDCGQFCTDDWDRDGVVEPEPSAEAADVSADTSGSSDAAASSTGFDGSDEPDVVAEEDNWSPSGQCSEWYGTAMAVGFTPDEWPTLDTILWQESRCDPGAFNSTPWFGGNASGLAQIIWPTWAGECGDGDIFDPWFNLTSALHLKRTYGWSQWSGF